MLRVGTESVAGETPETPGNNWVMILDFTQITGAQVSLANQIQPGFVVASAIVPPYGRYLPLDGGLYERGDYPEIEELFPLAGDDIERFVPTSNIPAGLGGGVHFNDSNVYWFTNGNLNFRIDGSFIGAPVNTGLGRTGNVLQAPYAANEQYGFYQGSSNVVFRSEDGLSFENVYAAPFEANVIRCFGPLVIALARSTVNPSSRIFFSEANGDPGTWQVRTIAFEGNPNLSLADITKIGNRFYIIAANRIYVLEEDLTLPLDPAEQMFDLTGLTGNGALFCVPGLEGLLFTHSETPGVIAVKEYNFGTGLLTNYAVPQQNGNLTEATGIKRLGTSVFISVQSSNNTRQALYTPSVGVVPFDFVTDPLGQIVQGRLIDSTSPFSVSFSNPNTSPNGRVWRVGQFPPNILRAPDVPPLIGAPLTRHFMFSGPA